MGAPSGFGGLCAGDGDQEGDVEPSLLGDAKLIQMNQRDFFSLLYPASLRSCTATPGI